MTACWLCLRNLISACAQWAVGVIEEAEREQGKASNAV
jgi:hypothetical protein